MIYPNLFKSRYNLKGKDWINRVSLDDKKAFIEIGMAHNQHGRLGGIQRAKNAKRDNKGRFIPNATTNNSQ